MRTTTGRLQRSEQQVQESRPEQAREHVGVYRREQDRRAGEGCEWLEVERAQEGEEEEDAAISMRDIFGSDSEDRRRH